jgi:hypothetical protein
MFIHRNLRAGLSFYSRIGLSVFAALCICLIGINAPIVYAEQKNILSPAHIMPTVIPLGASSVLSSQQSPLLQIYQDLNSRPMLELGSSSAPWPPQVVTTSLERSSLLSPIPQLQPVAQLTNSTPTVSQASQSPIQPASLAQALPVQIIQQPSTTGSLFQPGSTFPFLPSQTTTFPPSVFPPTTTSVLPPTASGTSAGSGSGNPDPSGSGNLSPWFPSLPAIGCGGTFSLTIVGDVSSSSSDQTSTSSSSSGNSDSHHSHSHHGTKALALQVNSAGGVDLTQESVNGKLFQGQNNIDNNQGNKFDIKDVFNNCQVVTFSR